MNSNRAPKLTLQGGWAWRIYPDLETLLTEYKGIPEETQERLPDFGDFTKGMQWGS